MITIHALIVPPSIELPRSRCPSALCAAIEASANACFKGVLGLCVTIEGLVEIDRVGLLLTVMFQDEFCEAKDTFEGGTYTTGTGARSCD